MKKFFLLIVLPISCIMINAQDVIVKKDGSTIISKVLEINPKDVKYKKFSNLKGPTYTIVKSEIMAINYENGEKESFDTRSIPSNEENNTVANNGNPVLIKKEPDARNAEIIRLYNHDVTPTKNIPKSNGVAKACYTIWNIAPASILSNEDIEISFARKDFNIGANLLENHRPWYIFLYHIIITNKTDKVVYIDKGNCFRIKDDGSAYCYYDSFEQTTVNHGSGSGISLGLGSIAGVLGVGGVVGQLASGMAVGGGTSNSISTTYSKQRIISIPPHSKHTLTAFKQMEKYPWKIIEHAEYFNIKSFSNYLKRGVVHKGEVLNYNMDDTPLKRKYIIAYSTDSNFNKYSILQMELYLRQIIGTNYLQDGNFEKNRHVKVEKYINGVNENTIIDWDFIDE